MNATTLFGAESMHKFSFTFNKIAHTLFTLENTTHGCECTIYKRVKEFMKCIKEI